MLVLKAKWSRDLSGDLQFVIDAFSILFTNREKYESEENSCPIFPLLTSLTRERNVALRLTRKTHVALTAQRRWMYACLLHKILYKSSHRPGKKKIINFLAFLILGVWSLLYFAHLVTGIADVVADCVEVYYLKIWIIFNPRRPEQAEQKIGWIVNCLHVD